jgi:hypothetical protein
MNALLASLKNDLLGRRLLPLLVLCGVALAGAVAYTVLGGSGSGSSTPTASLSSSLPPVPPSLASPAPGNPNQAVSETTSGVHYQRGGTARDPFVKLPEPKPPVSTVAPTPTNSTGSKSEADRPHQSKA